MSGQGERAGILLRLSEEKDTQQATDEAFERFESACRRLCDLKGWSVTEIFTDGVVSAYKGCKRNGFQAAMQALSDGTIDVLVVSDLDRLLRSWKDAATVDRVMAESGRTIVSADGRDIREDPYYPVHVGIAISESRRISQRVKRQAAQAAGKGRPAPGPRAYGYEPGEKKGELQIRKPEADIIREAIERLLKGESVGDLVRDFKTRGIVGTKGKPFTATSIRAVVCNPRVASLREYHGQELRKVRAIFDGRTNAARKAKGLGSYRPGRGRGTGRGYTYKGLLVCHACQGRLVGSSGSYRCGGACRGSYISADHFERVADELFIRRCTRPAFAKWLAERLRDLRADDTTGADLERDRADLADLEATPESIRRKHRIDLDGALRAELRGRVQAAEARLAAMPELAALVDLPTVERELRAAWKAWTPEQRRARLAAVVDRVVIMSATRRHTFDPSRIVPRWR